jgi:hypothetical protein
MYFIELFTIVIPAKAGIQQQIKSGEADNQGFVPLRGAYQSTGFPLSRE